MSPPISFIGGALIAGLCVTACGANAGGTSTQAAPAFVAPDPKLPHPRTQHPPPDQTRLPSADGSAGKRYCYIKGKRGGANYKVRLTLACNGQSATEVDLRLAGKRRMPIRGAGQLGSGSASHLTCGTPIWETVRCQGRVQSGVPVRLSAGLHEVACGSQIEALFWIDTGSLESIRTIRLGPITPAGCR